MYTRNGVLAVVAATAALVNGIVSGTGIVRGPATIPAPIEDACPESCGCLPKLCTDDAVLKGTTTHLTYLCPETQTVQVTKTIFVTVHDGQSQPPVAPTSPGGDDKTTIVTTTSKSTLLITKTLKSKHSTASGAQSNIAVAPSQSPGPLVPDSSSLVGSSTVVTISESKYIEPAVPTQSVPEPTTVVHISSEVIITIVETVNTKSSISSTRSGPPFAVRPSINTSGFILTNPLRPSTSSSGIWHNITSTDVVVVPTTSRAVISPTPVLGTSVSSILVSEPTSTSTAITMEGTIVSSTGNFTLTFGTRTVPGYGVPSVSPSSRIPAEATSTFGNGPLKNNPTPIPILSPVGHSGHPVQFTTAISTDLEDFPTIKSDEPTGFISLPPDSELFSSIFGEEPTVTDMEVFPTIRSDEPTASTVLTDSTCFSIALPPYPTAPLGEREVKDNSTTVDGTISKVYTTTTVTLQDANSTITFTKTHEIAPTSVENNATASAAYPGASTESLGNNGAGNVQPSSALSVSIFSLILMIALF